VARAGVRLLDALDNTDLGTPLWRTWIDTVTTLIQKAVTEGDIVDHHDPEEIAKMLVALRVGIRRISDLDQPSTTSIASKKHGYRHYPASPIPTESTTSPNSSNDATRSP
jgi:hypothetical protein